MESTAFSTKAHQNKHQQLPSTTSMATTTPTAHEEELLTNQITACAYDLHPLLFANDAPPLFLTTHYQPPRVVFASQLVAPAPGSSARWWTAVLRCHGRTMVQGAIRRHRKGALEALLEACAEAAALYGAVLIDGGERGRRLVGSGGWVWAESVVSWSGEDQGEGKGEGGEGRGEVDAGFGGGQGAVG